MVITVKAEDIWMYAKEHKSTLMDVMYEVASNESFGIKIFVGGKLVSGNEYPCIIVEADGDEVFSEVFISESDATNVVRRVYEDYLTPRVVSILAAQEEEQIVGALESDDTDDEYTDNTINCVDMEDYLKMPPQERIELREAELEYMVAEFIENILGNDSVLSPTEEDEIVTDCVDHFIEYLARKHQLKIFRPMYLEDEDGEDFYEEYPYECMEFDDEDNPIYQP